MSTTDTVDEPATAELRYRRLSPVWRSALLFSATVSFLFALYQAFNLGNMVGFVVIENRYFYAVLTILLPLAFFVFPASTKSPLDRVPWYDVILTLSALGISSSLVYFSNEIVDKGWEYSAPDYMQYLSIALWLLVLEATRRGGGNIVATIIAVVSVYPLFAGSLPGILEGSTESIGDTAAFHALSTESIIGIPFRAFANLVIGFLIFGVALQHTGGGRFFINLAFALLGHVRGGPAKVAIFASGLMGSMSGSVITNVLTTGSMSIPAMKRIGFQPHVAGGVEACASTGGVLMPPVMGATAFIMAINLDVPYRDIVIAAVIPSVLYFFALFMQIDAYAAKMNLKGMERIELPSVKDVMKDGWYYILVFGLLIYWLLVLNRESQAPFYATGLLILINQLVPSHRWSMAQFVKFIEGIGKLFAELAAVLAGVGLIVGALAYQSKVGTLAFDLLQLADNNVILLLLLGALASFIMGIGVTVTVAYIILAITLAPALTDSGLNPMGVHMFMLYWGMLSFITPPVALGAFAAASLAGANPMRTGVEATKLGTIIYFVPFFFVLDPGLIMQGEPAHIAQLFVSAMVGVVFLSTGLQGYLYGVGDLTKLGPLQWPLRFALVIGALALAMPGSPVIGFTNADLLMIGGACVVSVYLLGWLGMRTFARA
ncbi:MAG: TRAP transporter fused permease subunit [Rhodospirillaceae bacterium]|nr:TRAP transporter fused permease subunit [Rhodospirillaceae bacterium]